MNDNKIINSLKVDFIQLISTLDQIIENYPYNTLNKNKIALKYLHDLIYQFDLTYVFLNENRDINKMGNIDGKNIFPEFETNRILKKEEIETGNFLSDIFAILKNSKLTSCSMLSGSDSILLFSERSRFLRVVMEPIQSGISVSSLLFK